MDNHLIRFYTKNKRIICATTCIVLICSFVVGWYWCWYRQATVVLLVRHAERDGSLDQLTDLGIRRAEELVHVAGSANISAIYVTQFQRTQRTAQDLAAHLGITPVQFNHSQTADLINHIKTSHSGDTVLVVGHSNTVPEIIAALNGPVMPELTSFDNLFVVTLCRCRWSSPEIVNLKYAVPPEP